MTPDVLKAPAVFSTTHSSSSVWLLVMCKLVSALSRVHAHQRARIALRAADCVRGHAGALPCTRLNVIATTTATASTT